MNVAKYNLAYYVGPCMIATSTYWLIRYVFYVIFHLMDALKDIALFKKRKTVLKPKILCTIHSNHVLKSEWDVQE